MSLAGSDTALTGSDTALTGSDTADCILHVGPAPRGGWVVEAGDHSISASTFATREQACQEAGALAAHGWRMIVHQHPAAETWTTSTD